MSRQILLSFVFVLGLVLPGWAQKTVSGKVTDEAGDGIPGASVYVKGTQNGVVTDMEGSYSISVEEGVTLVFQSVGLKAQEVIVGTQTNINIMLKSDLVEVVVTGYQEIDSKKLIGSVSTIGAQSIEQVPMATFDQILQGRAPGLLVTSGSGQPGASANVRIRGQASLLNVVGANSPLYIMDGMPIDDGVFTSINPNDIESVSILKDASAAAIYGSRAANGVIIITTKKGKSGKTQLNYRFQSGMTQRTRPKFEMMNTAQKLEYERIMADNGNYVGLGGLIYRDYDNGVIDEVTRDERLETLLATDTNWADEFFRTGKHRSHEVNASGGSDMFNYFASVNYFTQEGITDRSSLERISSRLNLSVEASKNLRFGINTTFNTSKSRFIEVEGSPNLNNPFTQIYLYNPYFSVRDPETGEFTNMNPIHDRNLFRENTLNNSYDREVKAIGNIFVEYSVPNVEGLKVKTNWGGDYLQSVQTTYLHPESVLGLDPGNTRGAQGSLRKIYTSAFQYNGTTSLSYTSVFGQDHSIDVLLANEIFGRPVRSFNYTGYGLNDKLGDSPAAITTGSSVFLPNVGGSQTEYRLLAYFVDAVYRYKGKYSLKAGFRTDGSSKFGENFRYANFWNVGASWMMSDEAFLSNSTFVNNLKIRTSYGTVGNQLGIGNFASLSLWDAQANYNGEQAIRPLSPADPNLTWEESSVLNFGLDFGFLDNRISGSLDLYNQKTERLFIEVQLSRTSGFSQINKNAGVLRNRGAELYLKTVNVKSGKFEWSTTANLTYNNNKILSLGQFEQFEQGTSIIREGLPVGTHYSFEWAGVNPANGAPLYFDANGNITENPTAEDNKAIFGTYEPNFFGGFSTEVKYGGLSLSAFFSFVSGTSRFNNVAYLLDNYQFGIFNRSTRALDIWQEPGDITSIPGFGQPLQFSSKYIEDASYLRLRNVTIAYSLPQSVMEKIGMRSLRVYLQGQNILTFTGWSGFDPEEGNNIDSFDYPNPRMFTFGVDVGF